MQRSMPVLHQRSLIGLHERGNEESCVRSLKILCVLFIASFASIGFAIAISVLLAAPLVRWAFHGVLYFPVSGPELLRLTWYVLGMTIVMTALMWIEGRWRRRW